MQLHGRTVQGFDIAAPPPHDVRIGLRDQPATTTSCTGPTIATAVLFGVVGVVVGFMGAGFLVEHRPG